MSRRFRVVVNGQAYEVEVEEMEGSGGPRVPVANTLPAPPPHVLRGGAAPAAPAAAASGPAPAPAAPAPAAPAPAAPAAPGAGGAGSVTAPLPGTVAKVVVTVGQAVKPGDVLVVLEAMKMENEIAATTAGTVKEIPVTEGTAVAAGDVLVVIG